MECFDSSQRSGNGFRLHEFVGVLMDPVKINIRGVSDRPINIDSYREAPAHGNGVVFLLMGRFAFHADVTNPPVFFKKGLRLSSGMGIFCSQLTPARVISISALTLVVP